MKPLFGISLCSDGNEPRKRGSRGGPLQPGCHQSTESWKLKHPLRVTFEWHRAAVHFGRQGQRAQEGLVQRITSSSNSRGLFSHKVRQTQNVPWCLGAVWTLRKSRGDAHIFDPCARDHAIQGCITDTSAGFFELPISRLSCQGTQCVSSAPVLRVTS